MSRSTEQPMQFDFISGSYEAQSGMEKAASASRVQRWKERAEAWLNSKPQGSEFTADDLIQDIGVADEGENKNNVVGAWFNSKSKQRKIFWSGRVKQSKRVSRHTGLCRIWEKA